VQNVPHSTAGINSDNELNAWRSAYRPTGARPFKVMVQRSVRRRHLASGGAVGLVPNRGHSRMPGISRLFGHSLMPWIRALTI